MSPTVGNTEVPSQQDESSSSSLRFAESQSSMVTSAVQGSFSSELRHNMTFLTDDEVSDLRFQLMETEEELQSQQNRFVQLSVLEKTLQEQVNSLIKSLETTILSHQETIEKMTRDGDTQQQDLDGLMRIIRNLHERETASQDSIRQLEITIERQNEMMRRSEEGLNAQLQDSLARITNFEARIAYYQGNLQTAKAAVDNRFNEEIARQRIHELSTSLDAQQQLGREATEKLQKDLRMQWEQIANLQWANQRNTRELQMYREREIAQRRAGPSGYPVYPIPPIQAPTAPSPTQHTQGQPPLTSYLNQILSFPPTTNGGFVGNTRPPGWGRGAEPDEGAGEGPSGARNE